MSAPQSRRPLPALLFVGALTILAVVVWFRVLNRNDGPVAPSPSACGSSSVPVAAPTVLPTPQRVFVVVLNATNRNGLAAKTQKALTRRGFRVTQIGNDGPAFGGQAVSRAIGEIRYGPRAELAADLLHYYLPRAVLKLNDSSARTVTLSLGTRYRTLLSVAAVQRRLERGGITLRARPRQPAPKPSPSC